VSGTLLAGFVLLPWLGVWMTTVAAALANLAVARSCSSPDRGRRRRGLGDSLAAITASVAPLELRAGLVAFGVVSAVAMIYEEVWQRALQLVIGSSVYAFAILLASFLLGLAIGAAVYSYRTARQPGQAANLAIAQLLVALSAGAGALALDDLPAAFLVVLRAIPVAPAPALAAQSAIAACVVLVPRSSRG